MKLDATDLGDGTARLFIPGRPKLINKERSGDRYARAESTKINREIGRLSAHQLRKNGYVFPERATIITWPTYTNLRSWPDVGNWYPTTKAVVDGLVDGGAWPDDNKTYIGGNYSDEPRLGEADGLVLVICPYFKLEQAA